MLGIAIRLQQIGGGSAPILTASVWPAVQPVMAGDTWADLLLASATQTANYASTESGTIASAVAEVRVDGGSWTALAGNETTELSGGEVVQARVTVTDGASNERIFLAGTVVVSNAPPDDLTTFDNTATTFDDETLTFDEAG